MDRLIYTDRKTTGKKEKKNISGLKKYIPSGSAGILIYIKALVIGAVMGIGSFMVLVSTFGIPYSPSKAFKGGFSGSMVAAYNAAAAEIADKCGLFLNQMEGAAENCGLCMTFVLLILVVVSAMIVWSGNRWFAFVYILLPIVPLCLFGLSGSIIAYGVLALGIALFLADGTLNINNFGAIIYVAVIVVVAFLIISIPAISHLVDKPEKLAAYTEQTWESVGNSYYGQNPLHNGYLMDKKRTGGKGVALEVKMEQPHSMYLRGFVGDVLEEDGWKPLSNSVYYENRNLVYWLKESGFNGLGQLQQSADLAKRGGKKKTNDNYVQEIGDISIVNRGADSRYAYIPYEITADEILDSDGAALYCQNRGNSYVRSGWRNKLEDYSYKSAGNLTSTWTVTAAEYYSNNATVPEQEQYEICESHQNGFVYSNYLYISPEDRIILDEKIGNTGIQKRGHVEYNTAITNVQNIMLGLFTYSEKVKYKDKLSAFENIMNTYEGYDAQYATVAVMLFRYYGIPARYVEGYYITEDDIADGAGTVYVKKKNNHAWAEIYVDGIGFVPVETCPEYFGIMQEADYTIGISNKTKQSTLDQSEDNTENPNGGGSGGASDEKRVPSKILIIMGIIAGLIILALIVIGIIFLIRKLKVIMTRRRLFIKGEPKEASRAIYRRMEELELKPDEEAVDIGNRATYSTHIISDKERKTMLSKLKLFKKNKREEKRKNNKDKRGQKGKKE